MNITREKTWSIDAARPRWLVYLQVSGSSIVALPTIADQTSEAVLDVAAVHSVVRHT